jgi:hypothetical protein
VVARSRGRRALLRRSEHDVPWSDLAETAFEQQRDQPTIDQIADSSSSAKTEEA